ncbi:RNA-binding S4 domain-containing protein [Desulfobulbus alkaliphilus]|uniref:RNA-binding S4 domain-containing protein n=1 Tax=Desulfobulbus alkaliphilus TaxID=869814 RepID=UPI0019647A49|nr:RNA-binding S4 domain-containing protein [Desulfobulbus alkaliphilus]MBM9538407.1 RNA-binding S4 domain-containing protein [Desulfobulbus alkaliphilus]
MHTQEYSDSTIVVLNTDYIELDKLLKRENLAASGGEAGYLIGQGLVQVNGLVETRKRKKLRAGDQVLCNGVMVEIIARPASDHLL